MRSVTHQPRSVVGGACHTAQEGESDVISYPVAISAALIFQMFLSFYCFVCKYVRIGTVQSVGNRRTVQVEQEFVFSCHFRYFPLQVNIFLVATFKEVYFYTFDTVIAQPSEYVFKRAVICLLQYIGEESRFHPHPYTYVTLSSLFDDIF